MQYQRGFGSCFYPGMTKAQEYDLLTVSGRLQYLAAKRGKTENDIVEGTGLAQSTVNAALTGIRKNPSARTLAPIASYLGANLAWIANRTGEPFSPGSGDVADDAAEKALLTGIKHGLLLAGVDPDSAEFHRKVATAYDKAKAALAGAGEGAA